MITILCGRVAAGKTALAQRLRSETGALHLSCDELMLRVFDGCLGAAHDETAMNCLQYLFSVAAQAAENGTDAVLDYGFWRRAERDAAQAYFSARGLPYRLLLVNTPQDVRLARLRRRNEQLRGAAERVYLIEGALLLRMDAKFEPPLPEEGALVYDNAAELPSGA